MKRFIFLMITILIVNNGFSQLGQNNQNSDDPLQQMMQQQGGQLPSTKINADAPELFGSISEGNVHSQLTPLEGAIEPDKYIVGPNDLFNFGIFGYINQQVPIYVLPEGVVVIPTVGEVYVNGLTLRQAKEKVVAATKKRYYSSDVSFTLTMPRIFIVKVTGMVQSSYEVNSVTRPSEILKRLYFDTTNVSRASYNKNNEREIFSPQISLRNIELIRKNGTVVKVDIYKYFMTGEDRYNPYLLEGDKLKLTTIQMDRNYITITGGVQLPGSYEYSSEDDLETVVGLGRGFLSDAEQDSIVLFRPSRTAEKGFEVYNLSYSSDKDFPIENYDRLFVKFKADYYKKGTVLVLGEVERPGFYPISFKETKLTDVIDMSGGFTKNAYLPLSVVFRDYDQEYTAKDTLEVWVNQRANDLIISEQDQLNFSQDVQSRRHRMIVDFPKLFKENDQSQNVVLEDNDIVYINDDKKVVYVYGQVNNEGYVPYKEGEDYMYYIEKAGGYSLAAEDGNTRIIKFNSRGWYKPDDVEVQSGDFVYVPKQVKEEFSNVISIIAQVAGVVIGVITTFILISRD
jgi:polysaccharide export outer membrane protein